MPPEEIYQLGLRINEPEAEGLFFSCTNFRAAEVIERLEQELGKPVVTANQASMWSALRRLGVESTVPDAGQPLRQVPVH